MLITVYRFKEAISKLFEYFEKVHDLVRRYVLYYIITEFRIPMKVG